VGTVRAIRETFLYENETNQTVRITKHIVMETIIFHLLSEDIYVCTKIRA